MKVKLHSYAGEWVAFVAEQIVAHNKDLKDLMKEVDARSLRKKASVILVPRKDKGPYVFNPRVNPRESPRLNLGELSGNSLFFLIHFFPFGLFAYFFQLEP
jgi:hypothetical protein